MCTRWVSGTLLTPFVKHEYRIYTISPGAGRQHFHFSNIHENIADLFFHHYLCSSFHPMCSRINCSVASALLLTSCFRVLTLLRLQFGVFSSGVPSEGPIQRPVKVNGTFLAGVNYTALFTSANVDSLHQVIPPNLYLRENCFSYIYI